VAANDRVDEKLTGRLDRRMMVRRAAALGLSPPALTALVRERAVAQTAPSPPVAPRVPRIFARSGDLGVDPYAWLENPNDPAVIAYLDAENAYREAVMAPTAGLQESIYQELVGRIKQTDASVLTPWDGYLYYTRTVEGQQYGIVCRKQARVRPRRDPARRQRHRQGVPRRRRLAPEPDTATLHTPSTRRARSSTRSTSKDLQTAKSSTDSPHPPTSNGRAAATPLLYMPAGRPPPPFSYPPRAWRRPASDPLIYEEPYEHFSPRHRHLQGPRLPLRR
jgi:hypothetical protein